MEVNSTDPPSMSVRIPRLSHGFVEQKLALSSSLRCDQIHNGHSYESGLTLGCCCLSRFRCSRSLLQILINVLPVVDLKLLKSNMF